jgi:ribosomal protein S10
MILIRLKLWSHEHRHFFSRIRRRAAYHYIKVEGKRPDAWDKQNTTQHKKTHQTHTKQTHTHNTDAYRYTTHHHPSLPRGYKTFLSLARVKKEALVPGSSRKPQSHLIFESVL